MKHSPTFDPYAGIREANQLNIDVTLVDEDADSTRTEFAFNGKKMGYGVEDEHREVKVHGETRIPNGIYEIDFRVSPKFSNSYYRDDNGNIIQAGKRTTPELKSRYHTPHELIWVKDVPGFEYILWHWGNTADDTHGCYIVGSSLAIIGGQKAVGASRQKYEEIYPIVWRAKFKENKQIWVRYNR